MLDPENSAADKEVYDKLDPKYRDDVVVKRNNFTFTDLKKSKKAFKNRKDLDNSTFHTTKMDHVNFEKSNLEKSKFFNADLLTTNLKGANLKDSTFEFGIVDGANFEGANLEGVTFHGVSGLDRANFKGTIYEGKPGYGDKYTGMSLLDEVNEKRKSYLKQKRLEKKAALEGTAKGVTKRHRHKRSSKKRKHHSTKRRK
jgi:uncharacterized protein YjbI with pentapeptide repeats